MIGCGVHAKANIFSSLHMMGYPMKAVCARHLERAQEAAARFGIDKAYGNYKEMLDQEELDAVFVITEAASQADIVKECLQRGLHVFVEKPLGMNEQ